MRGKAKILIYALFLALSFYIAHGTTLQGNVYDEALNPLDKVIIEVNSINNATPRQLIVVNNGYFLKEIQQGVYNLKATYTRGGITRKQVEQNLSVQHDGIHNIDLILKQIEGIEEYIESGEEDRRFDMKVIFIIVMAIVILLLLSLGSIFGFRFYKKYQKQKEETNKQKEISDKITEEKKEAEDMYKAEKVLEVIKKHGGRTTQKDIRKELPLSEGKISLMVSELEHKGKIEKIKKGRGNIIILKES